MAASVSVAIAHFGATSSTAGRRSARAASAAVAIAIPAAIAPPAHSPDAANDVDGGGGAHIGDDAGAADQRERRRRVGQPVGPDRGGREHHGGPAGELEHDRAIAGIEGRPRSRDNDVVDAVAQQHSNHLAIGARMVSGHSPVGDQLGVVEQAGNRVGVAGIDDQPH